MSGNTDYTPPPEDNLLGLTSPEDINREEAKGIARGEVAIQELDEAVVISAPLILELHKTAFGHLYEWAGKWRTINIKVGQHIPPNYQGIPNLMYQFIDELNHRNTLVKTKEDVVKLLGYCHHQFVFIHPFVNGNGRTARLITNLMAFKNGYQEVNIYHRSGEQRQTYLSAVRAADNSNYNLIEDLIRQEIIPFEG